MTIRKNKTNAMFLFRINEKAGTAEDETENYLDFAHFLIDEFIPFSTFNFAFINNESDDCLYAVKMNNEYFGFLKTCASNPIKIEEEEK